MPKRVKGRNDAIKPRLKPVHLYGDWDNMVTVCDKLVKTYNNVWTYQKISDTIYTLLSDPIAKIKFSDDWSE